MKTLVVVRVRCRVELGDPVCYVDGELVFDTDLKDVKPWDCSPYYKLVILDGHRDVGNTFAFLHTRWGGGHYHLIEEVTACYGDVVSVHFVS